MFIDHPWFLAKVWGKTGALLYGPKAGADYQDNHKRFALFCRCAAAAAAARAAPAAGPGPPAGRDGWLGCTVADCPAAAAQPSGSC